MLVLRTNHTEIRLNPANNPAHHDIHSNVQAKTVIYPPLNQMDKYLVYRHTEDHGVQRVTGVCVYTRSSLKTKVLKDLTGISSSGFHQLWVQIQHNKLRSILLCVTYRPPDCPTNCFVDDFMDTYTQALTRGKKIFVVGDQNCDMLKILPETDTLNNLCSS